MHVLRTYHVVAPISAIRCARFDQAIIQAVLTTCIPERHASHKICFLEVSLSMALGFKLRICILRSLLMLPPLLESVHNLRKFPWHRRQSCKNTRHQLRSHKDQLRKLRLQDCSPKKIPLRAEIILPTVILSIRERV